MAEKYVTRKEFNMLVFFVILALLFITLIIFNLGVQGLLIGIF